ncbi:MAG: cobyrinate a,c-diamide synthase [Clostridiales bacterium]|nr:cobyrinate a,c-diamide synthase [Clostridiales bacterium]
MRDERYIRGEIPMTKEEVRAVSLSKLELKSDSIVYDIGAGTGSVTVEAAFVARNGHVYAFEQRQEGCRLIRTNCGRLGASNVTVVPGHCPESLAGFPVPDCVFIGGSSGEMDKILDTIYELNPQVRVVINVIALESLELVMRCLRNHGVDPEVICVQVSKAQIRGTYHLMQGMNPIYVISAGAGIRPRFTKTASAELIHPNIPRVMIAAPTSGGGKTVVTSGLLALLTRKGIRCSAFKCGPDYIDPMFHRYVLGIPGCNLDSFFLDERELSCLFTEYCREADFAIIEGVMGFYDGVGGCTCQASSYDIARITDTPVILLMDGRKSSLSLAAELKGFREYRADSRIVGVILNRTSQSVMESVRMSLEEQGVVCLGAIPDCEEAQMESRHLGLTIPAEQKNLRTSLEQFADRIAESLDVQKILDLAGYTGERPKPVTGAMKGLPHLTVSDGGRRRRIGVAKDEAFCFYYQANLDFLRMNGWDLVLFSPLQDEHLPENLDALLFGGGYPEIYAQRLSGNQGMIEDIRRAYERGVKILAECGGFLYLHDRLEGAGRREYDMVGLIHARGFRTDRRSRHFGYVTLSGSAGTIRGHEFHYWDSTDPGTAMKAKKPVSGDEWSCMHISENLIAGFPHLYYLSSPDWILDFLGR